MTEQTLTTETSLGELILALYEEYMTIYADEDLASVAVAATLNELFAETAAPTESVEAA
ncbi:MAG: hypothetical protein H6737_29260 [Alphaproteobacteria bacterium]|nr:hypothetical protein [Alphaproteobacteria bacterium]